MYLNHAGTSWPKPDIVQRAVAEALAAPPGTSWSTEALEGEIAAALGSTAERILFTPGCTSALHLGIADQPWQPGETLLLGPFEHLAVERPARALASRGVGVEIMAAGSEGAPLDLDAVRRRLRAGGVRLVAVSAAANVTGALHPLEALRALTAEAGAALLVDAAQSIGWWPLELETSGIDLVAFGGHKGAQGPWGIGGLFVREGHLMATPRAEGPLERPGWCDAGSLDRPALHGLAAGLRWLAAPERAARLERARAVIAELEAAVSSLAGVRRLGSGGASSRVPTLALALEGRSPSGVAAELAEEGIWASGGLQCAPLAHRALGTLASGGALRFSAGPEAEREGLERAIDRIRAVLS